MRILHLSTHDTRGGAAFSAWRLHQGLREIGLDSRMLVRTRHSDSEHVAATDEAETKAGPTASQADWSLAGPVAPWHERIATPWLQRQLPPDSAWTTVGSIDPAIDAHPWLAEADVLHLHWVAEWLSAPAIARLAALGKPLLWTFHDVWPVSCGVHFAGSNSPADDTWQTAASWPSDSPLGPILRREFQRKLSHLAPLPIQAVTPSQWLGNLVRHSHIGAGWQTQVIPYGIDTRTFAPGPRAAARQALGLPGPETLLLLFGAQALGERRKGWAELSAALSLAAANEPRVREAFAAGRVQLLLFGADQPDASQLPLPLQHLGFVRGEAAMADLYRAADAFLCPSLEDNLPNTVLEALACGTPVLGFTTGGLPDVIQPGQNGLLAPCGDADAFGQALSHFIADHELRQHLQTTAQAADKEPLALATQAQRLAELYRQLLAKPPASQLAQSPAPAQPQLDAQEAPWLLQATHQALQASEARQAKLEAQLAKAKAKAAPPAPAPAPNRPKRWWR